MKKKKAFLAMVLAETMVLMFAPGVSADPSSIGDITHTEMRPVSSATVVGNSAYDSWDGDALFCAGRIVTLSPFYIAQYETTYELWHTVYQWAIDPARGANVYRFANKGREGHDGSDGAVPTTTAKYAPVTTINWRDAIVWCNAYSEMTGKTAVYRDGSDRILRTSTNDTGIGTAADKAVMKAGANGYRLPTEAEWEYAARGGGTPSPAGPFANKWAGTNTESAVVNYAWYDSNSGNITHPVGGKQPNGMGLYDMSGNVWEWCWDWYDTVSTDSETDPKGPAGPGPDEFRMGRGGSWDFEVFNCEVALRLIAEPDWGGNNAGFRVVCAP
jgi:formylglycine-generating enzyme required for sulfatase activity